MIGCVYFRSPRFDQGQIQSGVQPDQTAACLLWHSGSHWSAAVFCSPGFRRQHCCHPRYDGGDAAAFFLGMYEKNGQPLEKLLSYYVQSRFVRPKIRPYKTNNYYAILMKGGMTHDPVLEKDR